MLNRKNYKFRFIALLLLFFIYFTLHLPEAAEPVHAAERGFDESSTGYDEQGEASLQQAVVTL